jgi:hypothetical protein
MSTENPIAASNYDNLLSGDFPLTSDNFTLASGSVLEKYTAMALNTSTNKIVPLESGGSDGTGTPFGILIEAADSSDGDITTSIFTTGSFNREKIVFTKTGDAWDDFYSTFRDIGILLKGIQNSETIEAAN